ncbi:hypothetical protein [Methylobrevis pamukkalensis]|uniref:hypothetical protein n=1 Tax=Methylobrevis pamukkalensis TaxID=1439726 RepID=UPI000845C7EF|nr:hypothetical protein [Methylobrevis pamukkalensis]
MIAVLMPAKTYCKSPQEAHRPALLRVIVGVGTHFPLNDRREVLDVGHARHAAGAGRSAAGGM